MNEVPSYGYRDDSDSGMAGELKRRPWTVDEVRSRAQSLGKIFEPNPEISDRLETDLAKNSIIVLFTPGEVDSAIRQKFVDEELRSELINLVSDQGFNDIAVLNTAAMEFRFRGKAREWFLTNNRC